MNDELSEIEVRERLAALEQTFENLDWRLMRAQAEQEFSREGLRTITELTRVMYLKNPLVQRGVDVKRFYVWGQGLSIRAADPEFDQVIQDFEADPKNLTSLTGHQARMNLEVELQVDGNLFFAFFVNKATGRVRVRTMPFSEIDEVICNPDDSREPWYYVRRWTQQNMSGDGQVQSEPMTAIYPDWRYNPVSKPAQMRGWNVQWGTPVYYVKVGGFSDWRFGVSEIYDTIDWARAYKEFLEDWASIVRAYRRFAFQLTTPGGSRGIAAAKSKLQTTYGTGGGGETNPSPVVGSTFVSGGEAQLTPIRTSGATVSAEDGRRLLLMVAASMGLPETFFGDASVGSLATAKSLDRPTELSMHDRRTLWTAVLRDIYTFVLEWATRAPSGPLRRLGTVERVVEDDQIEDSVVWDEGIDPTIIITWPPLIEEDVLPRVDAIVKAATLGGPGLAGTVDLPTLSHILLTALNVKDADDIVARLFPDGAEDGGGAALPERVQSEAALAEALRELRTALQGE